MNPIRVIVDLLRQRTLVAQLVRRDIESRYRGSWLGLSWAVLNPLLMLAIYSFVFGYIFKSRWNAVQPQGLEYTLVLYAGLIVHGFYAECINRAPSLVITNPNYVRKVVFPLELLPVVGLGTALFHTMINFALLMVFMLASGIAPSFTILLAPVIAVPLTAFVLGVCWFLAAIGVFIRDLSQTVGLLMTISLFISTTFYPIESLPQQYRLLVQINPITYFIDAFRECVLWGRVPDPTHLMAAVVGASVVAWLGLIAFERLRPEFADVL